jgi:filamentous hemagglutinin family protein
MQFTILKQGLISTLSLTFSHLLLNPALAQIIPDNTLLTNSNVTHGCIICLINGGTTRGDNLFHSFSEFSIPKNGEAVFNNNLAIKNIFTRVTGTSVSNIDGVIKTNGIANLFLINPNGIVFDANASLNLEGSLIASTANSIKFADGSVFSTIAPQSTQLLTVNVLIGLSFGNSPQAIKVQGQGHQLSSQEFFNQFLIPIIRMLLLCQKITRTN